LLRAFGWKVAHILTKDWHDNRKAVLEGLERLLAGDADEASETEDEPAEPVTESPPPRPAAQKEKSSASVAAILPAASAGAEWRRTFDFIEGGSRKFWEITVSGAQHTVRFGRLGSAGQSKTKDFADSAAADRDARRLINEKLAKGYVEK
jgi:predicted DNA-binding WGR domain protein